LTDERDEKTQEEGTKNFKKEKLRRKKKNRGK
jgi:hypothetical protein